MGRWITFDAATTAALSQSPGNRAVEEHQADLLTELLAVAPATALLRADAGQIAVLQVRKNTVAKPAAFAAQRSEPSGFLGLGDEFFYEDEPEAPKKKWWQRSSDR